MRGRAIFLGSSLLLAATVQAGPLRLKLTSGAKASYRVGTEQATYDGSGKRTELVATVMPYVFLIGGGNSLSITKGPTEVRGRAVGKSRVSQETVDAGGCAQGRAPANFFVCLPTGGAKVGQTWRAAFFGGPPLPAGLQANYRYLGNAGKFAIVALDVSASGAASLQGKGKLFLRLSDGFLDHGDAQFTLYYMQPDHNDRTKMKVNSRVVLKYTITAG